MFKVCLEEDAEKQLSKLDFSIQKRINSKLLDLIEFEKFRHLKHGLPFFVLEVGQHRVVFSEKNNVRIIFFVGKHKDYEKFCKKF